MSTPSIPSEEQLGQTTIVLGTLPEPEPEPTPEPEPEPAPAPAQD